MPNLKFYWSLLPHNFELTQLFFFNSVKRRKRWRHHSVLSLPCLHRLEERWVASQLGLIIDWWSLVSAHHVEEGFVVGEEKGRRWEEDCNTLSKGEYRDLYDYFSTFFPTLSLSFLSTLDRKRPLNYRFLSLHSFFMFLFLEEFLS